MQEDDADDRKMPARDGPGEDGGTTSSWSGPSWSNRPANAVQYQESSSSPSLPPPAVAAAAAASAGSAEATAPDVLEEDHLDDDDDGYPGVAAELPYLVTNYLLRYNPHQSRVQTRRRSSGADEPPAPEQHEAVERIRRAAVELAHAFGALGAFGTATRPRLCGGESAARHDDDDAGGWRMTGLEVSTAAAAPLLDNTAPCVPATFADIKRAWHCHPTQLEHLVRAGRDTAFHLVQRHAALQPPHDLVRAAEEVAADRRRNVQSQTTAARTSSTPALEPPVGDEPLERPSTSWVKPALFRATAAAASAGDTLPNHALVLVSEQETRWKDAATAVRSWWDLREKVARSGRQLRQWDRSLAFQEQARKRLDAERARLLLSHPVGSGGNDHDDVSRMRALDELHEHEQNCDRVVAQLERQCQALRPVHASDEAHLMQLERAARRAHASVRALGQQYRDPLAQQQLHRLRAGQPLRNPLVRHLAARERGAGMGCLGPGCPSSRGGGASSAAALWAAGAGRGVLFSRMSHAVTVNTHLAYPIYCLRFDRTGRYFVTGADDYLVRVFCIGRFAPWGTNGGSNNNNGGGGGVGQDGSATLAPARGAVLVCTLRGHAGVVNDIDVSSDNALLATASEDGDCRVWGLHDGCPVAILRGHVGGANMVSWSALTPYRLVTTGADGYARTWDVREACLKRYGRVVGRRPEYRFRLESATPRAALSPPTGAVADTADGPSVETPQRSEVPLPPLPTRRAGGDDRREGADAEPLPTNAPQPSPDGGPQVPSVPLPVPPLPPAAPAAGLAAVGEEDPQVYNGTFVANDVIDEGVQLLSKLKHGAVVEETTASPGTRSRRSPVKVICLARCPHGGHFATGSDDGVCRVWSDEDDPAVRIVDESQGSRRPYARTDSRSKAPVVAVPNPPPAARLLLTLKSHESAITDLQYSHSGDRLLTASQKDGLVKIYAWSTDPTLLPRDPRSSQAVKTSQIVIQLTKPRAAQLPSSSDGGPQAPRRRPKGSPSSVSCDVACWICDDTKVVTAQSELVKESGTEINSGSQFIFLWDSRTGSCLLGIAGAHEMQCPAVIPHISDPSLFCSIGADGFMKLWDCESGKVFFSYENKVEFGPIDPNDRGKPCGFLDGAFSPDGTSLVLTDDCGRVTVFDCTKTPGDEERSTPSWMREQYFSNDYYDLLYDSNGYCIEKGSECPPHLAPTGVRCSHGGVPHPDAITFSFKKLAGPLPLAEHRSRHQRRHVVALHQEALGRRNDMSGIRHSQFDRQATKLITGAGDSCALGPYDAGARDPLPIRDAVRRERSRGPRLSSNWRWSDYDDMLVREGADDEDEMDPDDEEFELTEGRGRHSNRRDSEEDSDEEELSVFEADSPIPARRRAQKYQEVESEGSESEFDEYMSTNKTPSGPFLADYDTFFFRMASNSYVSRQWLQRTESNTTYSGRKSYAPQLGDTLVYIPRAHQETINRYPRLPRPWLKWPKEVKWPVVRCVVKHLRYRFPVKDYFKLRDGNFHSAVALLTLEVSGVPDLTEERRFPWSSPVFEAPSETVIFELSVFQCDNEDFLVPVGLYEQRLSRLERHARENAYVETFYVEGNARSDPIFKSYRGRIVAIESNTLGAAPDRRIEGSGYRSIFVKWDDETEDAFSPWEVDAIGATLDAPTRGRLTENEKRIVQSAFNTLKEDPVIEHAFFHPVDETKYTDYLNMVEVPMDLGLIAARVETDFYVSKLSLVSDVKLMRDNCAKYNGEDDDLTSLANNALDTFLKAVLSGDEVIIFEEGNARAQANVQAWRLQPAATTLEMLPAPLSRPARLEGSRRQVGNRETRRAARDTRQSAAPPFATNNSNSRQLRSGGDVQEVAVEPEPRRSARIPTRGAQAERRRNFSHRRAVDWDNARSPNRNHSSEVVGNRGLQLSNRHGQGRNQGILAQERQAQVTRSVRTRRNTSDHAPAESHTALQSSTVAETDAGLGLQESSTSMLQTRPRRSAVAGAHGAPSTQVAGTRSRCAVDEQGDDSSQPSSTSPPSIDSDNEVSRRQRRELQTGKSHAPRRSTRQAAVFHVRDEAVPELSDEERDLQMSKPKSKATKSSSRRTTMSRRHSDSSDDFSRDENESMSEADAEIDSDVSENSRRRARKPAESKGNRAVLTSPRRTSSRVATARRTVLSGDDSDTSDPLDSDDNASQSDANSESGSDVSETIRRGKRKRRTAKGNRTPVNSPRRSSSRLSPNRTPKRPSREKKVVSRGPNLRDGKEQRVQYFDPSESDFDDVDREPRTPAKKRYKSSQIGGKRPKKKGKLGNSNDKASSNWPEIEMRKIAGVGTAILDKLGELDQEGIFAVPVAEAYPEMADEYRALIDTPMDFRTIREEGLPAYESVSDLQRDLMQTFHNCMVFNEAASPYYQLAESLLDGLDDVFRSACRKCKVSLPKHW